MKEFIEKLNEKLTYLLNNFGEHCEEWGSDKEGDCHRKSCSDCVLTHAIEIVNQLAEEYKGGWISVNDRLPEENGKYIVYYRKWTFGNYLPKFDEKEIRILRYSTNGWFFPTYGDVEAEKDIHREVIAWQPLPTHYKPKGE